MASHVETCGYRIVQCSSFERCGVKVLKKQLSDHEAICAFKLVECEFCGTKGTREEIEEHYNECEKCYLCKECLCRVSVLKDSAHSCVHSLALKMKVSDNVKDSLINHLTLELKKKEKELSELRLSF